MANPELLPVVGVDGCKQGWVAVTWNGHDQPTAHMLDRLDDLIEELRAGAIAAVALDMPIGLLDQRSRSCDVEARRLLGPRRSSVFPAPARAVLGTTDYRQACQVSTETIGVALSKQAYNLLPKIREVDRLVEPGDQDRLVEAHPECAFARLAGKPLDHPKRTAEGRADRRRLLRRHHRTLGDLVDSDHRLPELDLIDAAALAVTAARVVNGSEVRLGHEVDATGLAARITY